MASDMNDYFRKKKSSGGSSSDSGFNVPKPPKMDFNFGGGKAGIIYFIGGIILLLVLAKPFVVITEGERGILATNGKYEA